MKNQAALLLLLVLAASSAAIAERGDHVQVAVTDGGATSELLDMPIGASPNLEGALLSMKYFGPRSDSDISVVLTLRGAMNRYNSNETFGARFYAGDIPLSKNKYRLIDRTSKQGNETIINLHITLEELAWLASDSSAKFEIYNADTGHRYDTFTLTPTGLTQLKRFAKSALLIKSQFN